MTDDVVNLRTLLENSAPPPGRRAGVYSAVPTDAGLMKEIPDLTRPLEFQPAQPVSQRFAVKLGGSVYPRLDTYAARHGSLRSAFVPHIGTSRS
jgi:hypothetical protein